MIDILLISSSESRAREIGALLGGCGIGHSLRTEAGATKHLVRHAAQIKKADLLILEDESLALVDLAAIEDIANRREPSFQSETERAVFEFSVTLNERHSVPEALYRRAVDAIGERGVVELVGILGYYTLISMTLNTFEIDPPDGQPAELKP